MHYTHWFLPSSCADHYLTILKQLLFLFIFFIFCQVENLIIVSLTGHLATNLDNKMELVVNWITSFFLFCFSLIDSVFFPLL